MDISTNQYIIVYILPALYFYSFLHFIRGYAPKFPTEHITHDGAKKPAKAKYQIPIPHAGSSALHEPSD